MLSEDLDHASPALRSKYSVASTKNPFLMLTAQWARPISLAQRSIEPFSFRPSREPHREPREVCPLDLPGWCPPEGTPLRSP